MSEFDVRCDKVQVTCIIFDDTEGRDNVTQCYKLEKFIHLDDSVSIQDDDYDGDNGKGYVVVSSTKHAQNLIKALEKAIELEWLV